MTQVRPKNNKNCFRKYTLPDMSLDPSSSSKDLCNSAVASIWGCIVVVGAGGPK